MARPNPTPKVHPSPSIRSLPSRFCRLWSGSGLSVLSIVGPNGAIDDVDLDEELDGELDEEYRHDDGVDDDDDDDDPSPIHLFQ